jgi:hypothetical protein
VNAIPPKLTPEAKRWALGELARRAGVSDEFFACWRIEFTGEQTVVHLEPGTAKQVRFPNIEPRGWREMCAGRTHTLRASWMKVPGNIDNLIPDFPVPYCREIPVEVRPLFEPVRNHTIACSLDLLAAVLFMLCRAEEASTEERDIHGRVTARQCTALRDGFLQRPIVDEYGLAFGQALQYLLLGWHPAPRRLRVKLSHDIDEIGTVFDRWPESRPRTPRAALRLAWMATPWQFRAAVQETTIYRAPLTTLRQLGRNVARTAETALGWVRKLALLSSQYDLDSAFYWKASPLSPYDSGYDPRRPAIRNLIAELHAQGFENGVHPGYETFLSSERLSSEVEIVRQATGEYALGGRQHYLRWSPATWIHWEQCGLAYDSSVGYADHLGFRAGTCIPYRPWLFSKNREAALLEIPLIAMDSTMFDPKYMNLTGEESLSALFRCVKRCSLVGGLFTCLCHNTSLHNSDFSHVYTRLLQQLAGSQRFDWRDATPRIQSLPDLSVVGWTA